MQTSKNTPKYLGKIFYLDRVEFYELRTMPIRDNHDLIGTHRSVRTVSRKALIPQAQNTREFLEKLTVENFIVPVQISLSNVHIDYVKKVYDVEIIYFPEMNKAVVFGPTERALRAAAYLKSLTIQTDLESLKLPSSLKKKI